MTTAYLLSADNEVVTFCDNDGCGTRTACLQALSLYAGRDVWLTSAGARGQSSAELPWGYVHNGTIIRHNREETIMPETTETETFEELIKRAGVDGIIRYDARYGGASDYRVISLDSTYANVRALGGSAEPMRMYYSDYSGDQLARWHVVIVGAVVNAIIADAERNAPAPAPLPGSIIPRSLTEAQSMAQSLSEITRWLDGGDLHRKAQDIAANHPEGELCGSYEALVVPTFGWSPRRSEERWEPSKRGFSERVQAFESEHGTRSAAERLRMWADMFARGGVMNTAAVDHIDSHLEEHKIPAVNDLLESIGWDPARVTREYEIRVPVSRPVTYRERGYAYVTVSASDEDSALEQVSDLYSDRQLASMVDDWDTDYDYGDTDDYSAEADTYDAEIVN